jgi:hypothetical protein
MKDKNNMIQIVEPKKEMVATYKGKRFLLLYTGKTRTGRDGALLMLFNGQRRFWADADEISDVQERRSGVNDSVERNTKLEVSSHEVDVLLSALNREATVYRKVVLKKSALNVDKTLAKERLLDVGSLQFKLAALH